MSTTVCVNGTVQFTFLLINKLNITIVRNYDMCIVILVPLFFIIKTWKKKDNKIWSCQVCCDFFFFSIFANSRLEFFIERKASFGHILRQKYFRTAKLWALSQPTIPIKKLTSWPKSGFILEAEGSIQKIQKRAIFTTKKLKRAPLIWPPLCSYSLYNCFDKTNFWKK